MNYTFNYGNGVINLPGKITEHLALCDSVDIKTLIILSSQPQIASHDDPASDIAALLDCRRDKVCAALSYWVECGVLSLSENLSASDTESMNSQPQKAEIPESKAVNTVKLRMDGIPNYTGAQLEELTSKNGGALKLLLDECAAITGKVLNYTESNKIAAMSDYLGLSDEHILLLFTYCKNQGKTSIPYIEKMAYNLYDEGVDNAERLDEYFRAKEEREQLENRLRTMFGIGSRSFSSKEKNFLRTWINEFHYDEKVLEKAFEITVNGTRDNSFSFSYMNSVLQNWFNAGVRNASDAAAFIDSRNANDSSQNGGSFNTDEFFNAAVVKNLS